MYSFLQQKNNNISYQECKKAIKEDENKKNRIGIMCGT